MKALNKLVMDGKTYYIDVRLKELRNVLNPSDFEHESLEVLEFWNERAGNNNGKAFVPCVCEACGKDVVDERHFEDCNLNGVALNE